MPGVRCGLYGAERLEARTFAAEEHFLGLVGRHYRVQPIYRFHWNVRCPLCCRVHRAALGHAVRRSGSNVGYLGFVRGPLLFEEKGIKLVKCCITGPSTRTHKCVRSLRSHLVCAPVKSDVREGLNNPKPRAACRSATCKDSRNSWFRRVRCRFWAIFCALTPSSGGLLPSLPSTACAPSTGSTARTASAGGRCSSAGHGSAPSSDRTGA